MIELAMIWNELRIKNYRIARCDYVEFSSEDTAILHNNGKVSLPLCDSIDDIFRQHMENGQICLTPKRIKLVLYNFPTHTHPNNPKEEIYPENYFVELDVPQRILRITEIRELLEKQFNFYADIIKIFEKYGWNCYIQLHKFGKYIG